MVQPPSSQLCTHYANQIFDNVNHLLTHEMHQEEHLDSDVESDIDDNTISYHQYQLDSDVQDVPTEVSSAPPSEISMITILDDLRTQLDGHLKVNQEQSLVNDSLRTELARCKHEMVSLERNKVKHDLDQTIIQRNKRNAELEEENVLLKSKLSQNIVSINYLKNESKKVVSEKKVLEDKYLEEIVCLKSANKVATDILQRFQQPTQTIPMLTKRPNLATHDLHKKALGRSNPWNLKQAKLSQPTLYDGHALLNPTHTSVKVHDSEDSLVHAEVSRTKMSTRLGTIKPINYAELNALYKLSKSNAYSRSTFTAKINALTAENAKLKTELSGKKSSGSTASEKPKVLASGMYTNIQTNDDSKYPMEDMLISLLTYLKKSRKFTYKASAQSLKINVFFNKTKLEEGLNQSKLSRFHRYEHVSTKIRLWQSQSEEDSQ
ncbi:hypothetical protein Tco_1173010 [Tanacetum coccineum]